MLNIIQNVSKPLISKLKHPSKTTYKIPKTIPNKNAHIINKIILLTPFDSNLLYP